jgi:multidrug resistance efflux pump
MLFAVGWFVRYPDVVEGKVVLTTPEPPVRLVPRLSGEVAHRFVHDGDRVRPGQPLVALRSAARWEDVLALAERLERFERALGDESAVQGAAFDPMLSLGDLHPAYAAFLQSLSDYRSSGGYDARLVAELEQQIRDQQVVRENAVAKQRVLADQLDLAGRDRDRARAMAAQKLISDADADRAEAEYLQRRSAVQDGRSAVASIEVQISAARSQVLDLRQRVDGQGRNQGLALRTALATLRGAVARWDQENVIRAPSPGRVSLFRVVGEHQFVEEGAPLLAIVPEHGRAVGRVLLASDRAGRVEVGQRVLVRLESFPSREFGAVVGRVARISQLPMEKRDSDDAQYLVDVAVPPELVTTYHRRLPFRQEMRGDAEIVTRERRLISRLFDQVRGSVDLGGR